MSAEAHKPQDTARCSSSSSSSSCCHSTVSSALSATCGLTPFQKFAQRVLTESSSTDSKYSMAKAPDDTESELTAWDGKYYEHNKSQAHATGSGANKEQCIHKCLQRAEHSVQQILSVGYKAASGYEAELPIRILTSKQSGEIGAKPAQQQFKVAAEPKKEARVTPSMNTTTKCGCTKAQYMEQLAKSNRRVVRWIQNNGMPDAYDSSDDEASKEQLTTTDMTNDSSDATTVGVRLAVSNAVPKSCWAYKGKTKIETSQVLVEGSHRYGYCSEPAQLERNVCFENQGLVKKCKPNSEREIDGDEIKSKAQSRCYKSSTDKSVTHGSRSSTRYAKECERAISEYGSSYEESQSSTRFERAAWEREPVERNVNLEPRNVEKTKLFKGKGKKALAKDVSSPRAKNECYKSSTGHKSTTHGSRSSTRHASERKRVKAEDDGSSRSEETDSSTRYGKTVREFKPIERNLNLKHKNVEKAKLIKGKSEKALAGDVSSSRPKNNTSHAKEYKCAMAEDEISSQESENSNRYKRAISECEQAERRINLKTWSVEKSKILKGKSDKALAEVVSNPRVQNKSNKSSTGHTSTVQESKSSTRYARESKKVKADDESSSETEKIESSLRCERSVRSDRTKRRVQLEPRKVEETRRTKGKKERPLAEVVRAEKRCYKRSTDHKSGTHESRSSIRHIKECKRLKADDESCSGIQDSESSTRYETTIRECEPIKGNVNLEPETPKLIKGKNGKALSEVVSSSRNKCYKSSTGHKSTVQGSGKSTRYARECKKVVAHDESSSGTDQTESSSRCERSISECEPTERRVKLEPRSVVKAKILKGRSEKALEKVVSSPRNKCYKSSTGHKSAVQGSRNSTKYARESKNLISDNESSSGTEQTESSCGCGRSVRERGLTERRVNLESRKVEEIERTEGKSEKVLAGDVRSSISQRKRYRSSTTHKSTGHGSRSSTRHASERKRVNAEDNGSSGTQETDSSTRYGKTVRESTPTERRINLELRNENKTDLFKEKSEKALDGDVSKRSTNHKKATHGLRSKGVKAGDEGRSQESEKSTRYERAGKECEQAERNVNFELRSVEEANLFKKKSDKCLAENAKRSRAQNKCHTSSTSRPSVPHGSRSSTRHNRECMGVKAGDESSSQETEHINRYERACSDSEPVKRRVSLEPVSSNRYKSASRECKLAERRVHFEPMSVKKSNLIQFAEQLSENFTENELNKAAQKAEHDAESELAEMEQTEVVPTEKELEEMQLAEMKQVETKLAELELVEMKLAEIELVKQKLAEMELTELELAALAEDSEQSDMEESELDENRQRTQIAIESDLEEEAHALSSYVSVDEANDSDTAASEEEQPQTLNIYNVDEALLEMPRDYKGYAVIWDENAAFMDLPLAADDAAIKAKLMGAVLSNHRRDTNVWHNMNEYKYEQLNDIDREQLYIYTPSEVFHRRSEVEAAEPSRQLDDQDMPYAVYVRLLAERILKACCNAYAYEDEVEAEPESDADAKAETVAAVLPALASCDEAEDKLQAEAKATLVQQFHERFNRQLQNMQKNLWLSN